MTEPSENQGPGVGGVELENSGKPALRGGGLRGLPSPTPYSSQGPSGTNSPVEPWLAGSAGCWPVGGAKWESPCEESCSAVERLRGATSCRPEPDLAASPVGEECPPLCRNDSSESKSDDVTRSKEWRTPALGGREGRLSDRTLSPGRCRTYLIVAARRRHFGRQDAQATSRADATSSGGGEGGDGRDVKLAFLTRESGSLMSIQNG